MDKRSEPRFQIQSAIKIAAIDHPELVCEAMLLDVSGAGLKIVSDNWWPLETRIVVEMENHLVVARVRNIVARGPKFSLGAERLYSVLKHTLPAGASRTVWHNLLRAEMRDLPPVPDRAATDAVEPLEMAPPEMEVPTVRSAEIAEREGAARKITLRTSEPPEAAELRPEPPVVETTAEPSTSAEALRTAAPSSGSMEESAAQNPETLKPEPLSIASPSAASQQLPIEPPAAEQLEIEQSEIEQAAVDQSAIEQSRVEQSPEEDAGRATMAEPKPIESEVEPKVAGVIPEARPVVEASAVSFKKPAPVEALPSEPRPQALPTLRETVVPVASEALSSQPPAATEPAAQTVPPQTASPMRTATPPRSLEPANPVVDATGRTLRGTMQERRGRPGVNSKAPADPPMARAFPLVPNAAHPDGTIATVPLTPQFGPAYGMAPTADVLLPISTMPEVVTTPEAKPSWLISSGVAAAVIGLVTLAFYYGPFRPKAASAPRPQTVPQLETPLTIPAVTEAPSATTSAAANSGANPHNTQATAPANTPTSAQANPAPSAMQAAIAAAPTAIPAQSGQAQTGQTQTGTNRTVIKPVPVQMAKANSSSLPTQAAGPTQSAVANSAPTVSTTTRRVNIKAASLLWFSDCSDGKPAIQKVLQTGDSMDIEFHQMTVFKLGNAAAAQMTLDGKPLGVLGTPGTVKIVELTAAGLRELPPTTAPGAECQPMRASAKP
jgi:hypothetical protein